jgi:hypothetical protein
MTWIEPTQAKGFDGKTLFVEVKNSRAVEWLDEHIKEPAQEIAGVLLSFSTPEFEE